MQHGQGPSISRLALQPGHDGASPRIVAPIPPGVLRPSEYTAALIETLMGLRARIAGTQAIEIGIGCGVVLAAIAGLGARTLFGVDVEEIALQTSFELMQAVGAAGRLELVRGNLWQPVGDRKFDLVVANLPHFPTESGEVPERLKTWSDGGPDGRRQLDPFLDGLAAHLAPGGRAIITHNAFVGLSLTRRCIARHDLSARIVRTHLLSLSSDKLSQMSPRIRQRENGRSLRSIGPHHFVTMHIVEIRAARRST
jgi:methylase of polypeptide subunit release factors